jgi:hypothetical protein
MNTVWVARREAANEVAARKHPRQAVLSVDQNFVRTLPGGGAPLAESVRDGLSSQFGHDFSGVRIHTGEAAEASAQRMSAAAYTFGTDIVFGRGRYRPQTHEGSQLLAHELAHVVQQQRGTVARGTIQCKDFGSEASGAPADWDVKVKAAKTSADKAALLQQAVGIPVVDKTADSSADKSPTAEHLAPYDTAKPQVNFDAGLNAKESPIDHRTLSVNAGYTLHKGSTPYIVLGDKALNPNDFFWSRTLLSHEFDHVRQQKSGSKLTGVHSELDGWTQTFTRDFHRSYTLRPTSGGAAFVQQTAEWLPLLHYYAKETEQSQQDACYAAIKKYYDATIAPHAAHLAVFRYWVHRSIAKSGVPELATRLNADLQLGIDATAKLSTTRQFPLGTLQSLTYPPPPEVARP